MGIQRRQFLVFSSILYWSSQLEAKEITQFKKAFDEIEEIIREVQKHMFPLGSTLPAAESLPVTRFIYETVSHQSFDKDIRAFVLDGAKDLKDRTKGRFVSMNVREKEKTLRAYEETHYGSSWLSRIMTLTMEGMFSDPIYGVNIQEKGWKSLGSFAGQPRPTKRYLDV